MNLVTSSFIGKFQIGDFVLRSKFFGYWLFCCYCCSIIQRIFACYAMKLVSQSVNIVCIIDRIERTLRRVCAASVVHSSSHHSEKKPVHLRFPVSGTNGVFIHLFSQKNCWILFILRWLQFLVSTYVTFRSSCCRRDHGSHGLLVYYTSSLKYC